MSQLPTGPTKIADDHVPRSWSDLVVPEIPGGTSDPPAFYIGWLADYLTNKEVPFTPEQQSFFAHRSDWMEWLVEFAPAGLPEYLADTEAAVEIIESSHRAGETWEEFVRRQHDAFLRENLERGFDLGFEEEWCCDKMTWKAVGEEVREQQRCHNLPPYRDIPYRAYLSCEIRAMQNRDRAESLLREILGKFPIGD